MSTIEHCPARKSASRLLCLPLRPNEPSTDLKKRSTIIQSSLNQFDDFSQRFTEEILIDSAAQVALRLEMYWKPNTLFTPDFSRDYPPIVKVDLNTSNPLTPFHPLNLARLVEPHLEYAKFITAALSSIDGSNQICSAHYECRSDDSFSSIIGKLLPQLGIQDEFSESTAELLESQIQKLTIGFRHSHRIRGSIFETLLEYFRQFSGNRVVFIVDSAIPYERLGARYKYACNFVQPEIVNSSEILFQKFVVYLIDNGYKRCILTPDVLDYLAMQCSTAQLPLPYILRIIKYCVFRTLGSSTLFTQIPADMLESHFPADEAEQVMSTFVSLTDGIADLAMNNTTIFKVFRSISEEFKTAFELVKETLVPGFGTKAFLDRYYDKLTKLTPDEFVRILLRIKSSLEKGHGQLVQKVLALGGLETDEIRSQGDLSSSVIKLQEILSTTEYLNTDHPFMPIVMYYEVSELESLFFADIGKSIQDSLKYPEQYLAIPKSNGRKSRNKKSVISNIPDSARLYKLTLEWQRMINLHDLYFQFQSQVHVGPKKVSAEQQKEYMARFMQSVNELELVGVWSSHGRKRDTYERRNFTDATDDDLVEA